LGSVAGYYSWAGQSAPVRSQRPTGQPTPDRRGSVPGGLARELLAQAANRPTDRPVAEPPADFPAFVVETVPKLGDFDVDPAATKEIRVTFSKPMQDRSWSWTKGNVFAFPESAGEIRYLPDRRTCVMPVKLEPGRTYVIGINGARFNGF